MKSVELCGKYVELSVEFINKTLLYLNSKIELPLRHAKQAVYLS